MERRTNMMEEEVLEEAEVMNKLTKEQTNNEAGDFNGQGFKIENTWNDAEYFPKKGQHVRLGGTLYKIMTVRGGRKLTLKAFKRIVL